MHTLLEKSRPAFTRVELCVVVAVISVLAALVLPALAREEMRDWRTVCLRRMSQLANAMTLYAVDNRDYLPPNPDDGSTTPGHGWCAGQAGVGGGQEFNPDLLRDPRRTLLAPYLGRGISAYKCPLDLRIGTYQGSDPALKGQKVRSARTVSLNNAVGTDPNSPGAKGTVSGLWLDGQHTYGANGKI